MDYIKCYQFKIKNQEAILINGSTGEEEYKIESIDLQQYLFQVSALNRDDKIKIPFYRVEKASMETIRQYYPEDFI
jgi:hypothetical protein